MMAVCGKCAGEGVVEKDGKLLECECAIIKRLAFTMPPEVRLSKVLEAHAAHPVTDMMGRSLFITAAQQDLYAIIKAAIFKSHGRHVRMTSDARIRDVGVGSTSRKAQGDDAQNVYNSFSDLMEAPALVVVQLNKLGFKNRAAAGFLEEALIVRIDKRKPTWVASDVDSPFGPGCVSYSDAVWSLLHTAFERQVIPRILHIPSPGSPVQERPKDGPFSVDVVNSAPAPAPRRVQRPKVRPSDDDGVPEALRGVGSGSSRKKFQARED